MFIVLMSLLGAMSAFATDMSLAAVEPMARDLHVAPGTIGLSLSAFMISFAASPLAYGPMSDRFGRRPVALLACLVYVIGGIGCIFSQSLPSLLVCRFVQGVGGGARPLGLAIIGDHFKGPAAREKMSYVSALSLLAPLLAPSLGALLMELGDWRFIYIFLTLAGAVALGLTYWQLGESLPEERRVSMSLAMVARNYATVFRDGRSLPFAVVAIAMFGVIFGYVSGSPYVMIGAFHLTPLAFGLTFMLNSSGLLLGNLVNARLNRRGVAPAILLAGGLALVVFDTLVLVAITLAGNASVALFLPFLFFCMAGCSITNTNAIQLAIEPLSHIAGTASAAVVSAQLGFGTFAGYAVAAFYDGHTAFSTTATIALTGLCGLAAFLLRSRRVRETEGDMQRTNCRPALRPGSGSAEHELTHTTKV